MVSPEVYTLGFILSSTFWHLSDQCLSILLQMMVKFLRVAA